jgi:hypothetical protein
VPDDSAAAGLRREEVLAVMPDLFDEIIASCLECPIQRSAAKEPCETPSMILARGTQANRFLAIGRSIGLSTPVR